MKKYCSILLIAIICITTIGFAKNNWKILTDKNGIKVYSRTVSNSPYHEFKAVTIYDTRFETLIEVMKDIKATKKWVHNCKEVKIIKKKSDYDFIMYTSIDFPSPISDRDIVFKSNTTYDKSKKIITINLNKSDDKLYPRKKNHVRMPAYKAKYIIKYLSKNRTKFIHIFHLHPGGNIPAFIVNSATKDSPYKSFINLKKMLNNKKYNNREIN